MTAAILVPRPDAGTPGLQSPDELKVPSIVPPDAPLPAEIDKPPPAAPLFPVREPNTDSPPQHV